jgi:hypothetical protein
MQKPAPGQDLSNDTKYEKIESKEPRVQWSLISTTNRQIYISKLKPVKDIERLIKIYISKLKPVKDIERLIIIIIKKFMLVFVLSQILL